MRGLQQEGVEYRQLVGRFSNVVVPGAVPSGASCPKDVDWYEVAAGLWPDATKESASTKPLAGLAQSGTDLRPLYWHTDAAGACGRAVCPSTQLHGPDREGGVALLVSGPFLGEGFICIVMASPLFYATAIIIGTAVNKTRKSRSRTQPTVMGLIVLALLPMSFEGTAARLSFNRDEVITTESLVHTMPAEVRNAIAAQPSFHRTLPPYLRRAP